MLMPRGDPERLSDLYKVEQLRPRGALLGGTALAFDLKQPLPGTVRDTAENTRPESAGDTGSVAVLCWGQASQVGGGAGTSP